MYVETMTNGKAFTTFAISGSHTYVARAPASGQVSSYTLRTDGVDCTPGGFGGSSAALMSLSNQRTKIGGGNGTGAGVYRDATGEINCLLLFNANLTGTDLTTLETELALHV